MSTEYEELLDRLEKLIDDALASGASPEEVLGAIDDAEAYILQKEN